MSKDKMDQQTEVLLAVPPIPNAFTADAPSLGLAYLAACLEPYYKVKVFECHIERIFAPAEIFKCIVEQFKPKVIGFSLTTLSISLVKEVVDLILSLEDRPILMAGGPHATALPSETLAIGFDYVISGEGEKTIVELMDYIFGRSSFTKVDDIDGIAFRRGQQVIMTNKRGPTDMAALPYPAWHYFKIEKYNSFGRKNDRCLPVMAGRGCPDNCTFCFKDMFGTKLRLRDPKSVVDEIQHLKDSFHIEEFAVLDENFTTVKSYVLDFCNLLIERQINLPWFLASGVRVDRLDEEIVKTMKLAGCYRTSLGVESGNEKILKDIKKKTNKSQVREAVALFKKYKYTDLTCFFLIGSPTETYQTVQDSINFAIELDPDIVQFSIVTPYPGTAMYKQLDSEGLLLSKDWQDYNIYIPSDKPVFRHPNLAWREIRKLRRKAYIKFYFRKGFIVKQLKKLQNFADIKLLCKRVWLFLTHLKRR